MVEQYWKVTIGYNPKVGATCAEHFAVNFVARGAAPWWSGTTSGDTVCTTLRKAPCSQVVDWQGRTHTCSEMCPGSRMVLCGASRAPKRCVLCSSGECGPCPTPDPPPPPGATPTPNWQGCTTALAKALPYCDATNREQQIEGSGGSLEPPGPLS